MTILPFIRSTWITGLRSRSFQMVFALGLCLLGAAWLASLFSPRQPQTVALDVGFSGIRFTLVLLPLFWVQELLGREIERRTVILTLAYPVPRAHYVLGRFAGLATLTAMATLFLALLLWLLVLLAGEIYEQARPVSLGLAYWLAVAGIYLDAIVILAFALCLACLSTVLALPLALGAVFAIAGRSLGAAMDFLLVRQAGGDAQMVAQFAPIIRMIRWVLPDLSRLDWREIPLYGLPIQAEVMGWASLMAGFYIAMLLAVGVLAFQRREFN